MDGATLGVAVGRLRPEKGGRRQGGSLVSFPDEGSGEGEGEEGGGREKQRENESGEGEKRYTHAAPKEGVEEEKGRQSRGGL